jgi:hypothetical protein
VTRALAAVLASLNTQIKAAPDLAVLHASARRRRLQTALVGLFGLGIWVRRDAGVKNGDKTRKGPRASVVAWWIELFNEQVTVSSG